MSKKSRARQQAKATEANAVVPPIPAPRGFPWKWLALLVIGVGAGFGIATLLDGSGPIGPAPAGMVWIPGGKFTMGTKDTNPRFFDAYPEHEVELDGFWIDETEVTNSQYAEFVKATGYVTVAEQTPTKEQIMANLQPGVPPPPPEALVPGSLVFRQPDDPVSWDREEGWWEWVPGACWKHPEGPGSSITDRMDHPVVHVCWKDAEAYCKWAGKRLPTEAEWERAARGGLAAATFAWGDDVPDAGGKWRCNIWQGNFPDKNTLADGYVRTAPVKSYPPNGYGLYEVAGNVWEWCADWYMPEYYKNSPMKNPQGPGSSYDPRVRQTENPYAPKRVMRGGSFLCSDGFCARYKPYGRGQGDIDTGQSHVGFRCAKDAK
ncbi:MAG: formylglycine-generating enzyme family protein [Planctomycetaceae bacterium]|nr:formylglycine-generating enzyme family protein [Planctomycetaceae bacterium]